MGYTRISPAEVRKFAELYQELGTYASVARATGRSASSVKKYLSDRKATATALTDEINVNKGKKKK